MRTDQFIAALPLLPEDLRARAEALRPHRFGSACDPCRRITDSVDLAVTAAHYDEIHSAAQLLADAEQLVDHPGHTATDGCADADRHRATSTSRGVVAGWARFAGTLVAATDASCKDRASGLGYVISNGRFGLGGRIAGRLDPSGPSRVLVDELRAVDFLLDGFTEHPERLTVLLDCAAALRLLHRWQAGDTSAMPPGYSLRPRIRSARPTLVRLADRVARLPGVTFTHVKGHSGNALNEAADALSSMARRRIRERFDVRTRAESLVDAFLRDWHSTPVPRQEHLDTRRSSASVQMVGGRRP
ncbi:RNase H family protein [Polymorphospora sp. NPDC051019]|uniref:ribonuclease HI n=1 Tax=Polymorphospora sp. NPDC051019 TaxID=3155725 RepID=UPI003426EAD1